MYGSISIHNDDAPGTARSDAATSGPHPALHPNNNDGVEPFPSSCCAPCCNPDPPDVMVGASLNFVNSIIGAGCIGYGGAIGSSGGGISIVSVLFFAYLTKLSFDLTISLSIDGGGSSNGISRPIINGGGEMPTSTSTSTSSSSFESLGRLAYGRLGEALVGLSKWFFSFGCMVAYIIIVKDNFASAMRHLLFGINNEAGGGAGDTSTMASSLLWIIFDDNVATLVLSTTVILPLSLLRDVSLLERFSLLKIIALILIAVVLFILFLQSTWEEGWNDGDVNSDNFVRLDETPPPSSSFAASTFYSHWIEIRPGFVRNMGTFVLTFTANHTIHLVFFSLKSPHLQTLPGWKKISSLSIVLSSALVLPIGLFPYMTFWEKTGTNLFLLYPASPLVDGARLLLSLVMLLTYPMPFFACRELLALLLPQSWLLSAMAAASDDDNDDRGEWNDLLLVEDDGGTEGSATSKGAAAGSHSRPASAAAAPPASSSVVPLSSLPCHVMLTVTLWAVTVVLALAAPSLGDVLNLVGCATGTMISFVLPGLFALRLRGGRTGPALLLLVVGGLVGCMGSYFSLLHLFNG